MQDVIIMIKTKQNYYLNFKNHHVIHSFSYIFFFISIIPIVTAQCFVSIILWLSDMQTDTITSFERERKL